MNHILKRAAALILALIFAFSLTAAAFAEPETEQGEPAATANITIVAGEATFPGSNIYIPVTIENSSGEDVELQDVKNITKSINSGDPTWLRKSEDEPTIIPAGKSVTLYIDPKYDTNNSGIITDMLEFSFKGTANGQTIANYANISADFGTDASDENTGDTPDAEETKDPPFRLSSYDANGQLVPAPSGDAGDRVPLRIPLQCLRSDISNVTIEPVLSTSLDSFPFEIAALNYTQTLTGSLYYGAIVEFRYGGLELSEKVTAGVKKVDFTISWYEDWGYSDDRQSMTISLYVNVIDGYEGEGAGGDAAPVSKPKVILDSYSISTDKIYAGEQFDVTFTLRNTSDDEAVQNIQISLSDTAEVGKLMPANNGSNTLYIAKIGKGETHTETISLQSAPDTEAKAYTLQLDFSYEGAENVAAYTATETIAIPILQRIRLKLDDPVIYDDPWVGQSCAIYFALYNMGKAPIYNCMVDVAGEGLAMEETYFGGTVGAGSTMRADFSIIPSVGGEIAGEIVITYEDVYGEQMEERLPLDLFVNEEIAMDDPGMMFDPVTGLPLDDPGMMIDPGVETIGGASGGFPWVWAGVGAAVVIAGIAVAVILIRKKRAKELEDV